jgi:hypothetical protein
MLPSVPEISSRIHFLPCFRRLACHPTPTLSLCASSDLCWVLAAPLCSWLVGQPPLSAFAALWCITESPALITQLLAPPLTVQHQEISFCPTPFSRVGSVTPPMSVLDYSSLFMVFSFAAGEGGREGSFCPRHLSFFLLPSVLYEDF